MGSDQKNARKNGHIYYFDNRIEERVESCSDLDHWASKFGVEALDELVKKLAKEDVDDNDTYKLAECFMKFIENGGKDDGSDCYAFYMALIEELGIDPEAVKDEEVRNNDFDITLPMSDGPFTVSVKPFAPYVPEPWRSEIAKKANDEKARGKKADDQEDDGKRVDPRWHYFVSWAKYWDVILNSNSEYAALLRKRDLNYVKAKNHRIEGFGNAVLKKWCGKS